MLVSDNYFKKPITTITAVLILVLVDVGLGPFEPHMARAQLEVS